jgi:hypothetical protein
LYPKGGLLVGVPNKISGRVVGAIEGKSAQKSWIVRIYMAINQF